MKLFSDKTRPVSMGPYPLERLKRGIMPDLSEIPEMRQLSFHRPKAPENIVNAMGEYLSLIHI